MKTKSIVLGLLCLTMVFGWQTWCGAQTLLPDIKVNGSDGPVFLSHADRARVSLSLNSGGVTTNGDWWLVAVTPYGIYLLTPNGWSTDIRPAHQGPLLDVPSVELFSIPMAGFPAGTYAFFVAVDTVMDERITWDRLLWDGVLIRLTDEPVVSLSDLPLEFHRRAAQHIEEMRTAGAAPNWESAKLGSLVHLFYRPDVNGVAYYEFEVEPAGFIILSTGEHDFPVPHWSSEGETISGQLKRRAAESGKSDATGLKLFKLDALSYAAEEGHGELIATVGNPVVRIGGMDSSWLGPGQPVTEVIAQPAVQRDNDQRAPGIDYTVRESGQKPSPIQFSEWESWRQLKAGYSESYGILTESLRRDAREDWETERAARDSGEGLLAGETYRLALLYQGSEIRVSGEGAAFVEVRKVDNGAAAEIRVLSTPPGGTADLNIAVTYGNGASENFKFVIVDSGELRVAGVRGKNDVSADSDVRSPAASAWSPWTMVWAGTAGDQRRYHQFDVPFAVGSCPTGCGATAWAMLFGWGDHQAALKDPYWQYRTGLYYQNGGAWPSPDADAPQNQDKGVENITNEIRGYIGSICWAGWGGPQTFTLPWEMDEAHKYFVNRTGTTLKTDYSSVGIAWSSLREQARDSIWDRKTPAIIGTGWLEHYPLAWGYAYRSRTVCKPAEWLCLWTSTEYSRWFHVNQGWATGVNEWVSASTWFVGEIYP